MITTLMSNSSPISTPTSSAPVLALSSCVTAERSAHTSPVWSRQGTGLSVGRTSVVGCSLRFGSTTVPHAPVAPGARVTDLLGLPLRGAPV